MDNQEFKKRLIIKAFKLAREVMILEFKIIYNTSLNNPTTDKTLRFFNLPAKAVA